MEQDKKVLTLNVDDILPNRFQPRISFDEEKINELATSIKEHGVIQPIVVRKISENKYEIIAGERRYKASLMAGKTNIPAIVSDLNDRDSAEIALIENVQRQDLTPIEEAVSYKKILDMGYINQEGLAKKLGKSQASVANKLRLLNLDDEVQEALLNNQISERHARSLLKLSSKDQVKLLKRIVEERLTVKRTDEEIKKIIGSEKPQEEAERIYFDIDKDKKEVNNVNNDNINPGFVDLNKIQENAQDINPVRSAAPVEQLLTATADTPQVPTEPVYESPIVTGKFFGMLNNGEQEETVNMQQPSMNQPVQPVAQPVQQPVQPAMQPTQAMPQEPSISPQIQKEIPNIPAETLEIGSTNNQAEQVNIPGFEVQNEYSIPEPSRPNEKVIEPVVPDYSFLNNMNMTQMNDQTSELINAETPQPVPETISFDQPAAIPEQKISVQNTPNIEAAKEEIKNLADKLRGMGFGIQLDEFDLENMYQVVFKVQKD